jgi:hypothetical protein
LKACCAPNLIMSCLLPCLLTPLVMFCFCHCFALVFLSFLGFVLEELDIQ